MLYQQSHAAKRSWPPAALAYLQVRGKPAGGTGGLQRSGTLQPAQAARPLNVGNGLDECSFVACPNSSLSDTVSPRGGSFVERSRRDTPVPTASVRLSFSYQSALSLALFALLPLTVRFYDTRDHIVAHDIRWCEARDGDAGDILQDLRRLAQAG